MTKTNENYRKIKAIFDAVDGADLHEKKGEKFHFTFYATQKMQEADIEVLDLGVRSYNGLKRAGYNTVGQLVDDLGRGVDLKRVRNCGAKSYAEIMEHLFLYNLSNIPQERMMRYLAETVEKNR